MNSSFSINPAAVAVRPDGSELYFIVDSSSCTYGRGIAKSTISGNTATNATLLPCGDLFTFNGWTARYSYPSDLKVDSAGNVYIADYGAGLLWKIAAGNPVPSRWIALGMPTSHDGTIYLGQPSNLAVSQAGTYVYLTYGHYSSASAFLGGCVGSLPTSAFGTSFSGTSPANINCNLSSIGSGLNVDATGNIYASGYTTEDSVQSYYVYEVTSSAITPITPPTTSAITNFGLDSDGAIYLRTDSGIMTRSYDAINLGSKSIGSTSAAQPLTFVFSAGGQLGGVDAYTLGATGSDFGMSSSTTCNTTTSYQTNDSCKVYVTMKPAAAGLQRGAVVLKSTSGTPLVTVYIYGTGTGAQAVLWPAARSTAVGSFNSPAGIAIDGSNNLYITDGSSLYKETLSSGSYARSVISNLLNNAAGVAVDGPGNIYVADKGNKRVLRFAPSGSSYTQSTVVGSLSGPASVAVDGVGNVYVADGTYVYKETLTNGSYAQSTVLSSLSSAAGVCVDSNGNVYATDKSTGSVLKATLSGGSYTQSTITSSLSSPAGIAVDGGGNLYIAEEGAGRVVLETYNNGSYTEETLADNGTEELSYPTALAFNGNGDLYIVESGKQQVVRENVSDSTALAFLSTKLDVTSSDSPKALNVVNIGNANVRFTVPTSGTNPVVGLDFQLGSSTCGILTSSSSSFILEPGSLCSYSVIFHPPASATVGTASETFSLATIGKTLAATLAGTILSPVSLSPAAGALTSGVYGASYSQTFSANDGTAPYTYQVTMGSLPEGLSLDTSSGVLSGTSIQTGSYSFHYRFPAGIR